MTFCFPGRRLALHSDKDQGDQSARGDLCWWVLELALCSNILTFEETLYQLCEATAIAGLFSPASIRGSVLLRVTRN